MSETGNNVQMTEKLLDFLFGWIVERTRLRRRAKAVENWLRANTTDRPGDSHRKLSEIALNLGLSEDEVNKSVIQNPKIYRSKMTPDQVSIWRQDPQSVYDRRGVLRA